MSQKKYSREELIAQYGVIRGNQYHIFGVPEDRVTEREPHLPWYAQGIFYVASVATLLVFASSDIVALQHADFFRIGVISIMIGMLLLLVYAIDRTLNRTIPRMFVLAQRGQWPMFAEHVIFMLAVGIIEIGTLFIVILHENDIESILAGKPLIPTGSFWFVTLALSRAILAFWTVIHSFLVNDPLPVQWSTIERELSELGGGKALAKVKALDLDAVGLGDLVNFMVMLFNPAKRAARTWKAGDDRAQRQAVLDTARRLEIVAALDRMDKNARAVLQSAIQQPETIDKPQAVGALPEPVQRDVSSSEPEHPKPAETGGNVAAVSPSEQRITAPDDPRLLAIPLPEGWSLETLQTQKALYEAYDIPASSASVALKNVPSTPGSHGAKLYETWEALACFMNAGIMLQPTFQTSERYSETTPDVIAAYAESAA